jgi:AcrR family transcriptional regulator
MPKTDIQLSTNAYHGHRKRQRQRILEAAKELFDERGIDRVTMADITSASGIRASTLYQYFSSKEYVVWAILTEALTDVAESVKQKMESATTGFSKIAALLNFIADELSNNPARVRFMAQFDAMYSRDWPAERLVTLEAQINPDGFRYFNKLIREGIADGSLRRDLDPDLTMHALINAVIGAQRRLASLGSKVELEYGQPVDRLFRETVRVILMGLRSTDTLAATKPSKRLKARKSTAKKRLS